MNRKRLSHYMLSGVVGVAVLALSMLISPDAAQAGGLVGDGTPASCTGTALSAAVASGGLVTFNCGANPHTIIVDTLVIDKDTTIEGGGVITLDGENLRQIFYVQSGASLTVKNLTLKNADAVNGGAIYNLGTVIIQNSIFQSNTTTGSGGAIHNLSTLSVERSAFLNNSATVSGGAIFNHNGVVTVTDTTFSVNKAAEGGAIAHNGGTSTLLNALLMGNEASTNGGGIRGFAGTMVVTNVTFAGNFADRGGGIDLAPGAIITMTYSTLSINHANIGGGIFSEAGSSISLRNTVLADSLERNGLFPSLNCDNGGSPVQSLGYNLSTDNSCNLNAMGDQPGVSDAKLGPIADNGGLTQTLMPQPDSPLIDAGQCLLTVTTDQRGALRPAGATCDIGAVEYGAAFPVLFTYIYIPLVTR